MQCVKSINSMPWFYKLCYILEVTVQKEFNWPQQKETSGSNNIWNLLQVWERLVTWVVTDNCLIGIRIWGGALAWNFGTGDTSDFKTITWSLQNRRNKGKHWYLERPNKGKNHPLSPSISIYSSAVSVSVTQIRVKASSKGQHIAAMTHRTRFS